MQNHEKYIKRCFELASFGVGNVSPNPLVGSVIVQDGKIISEGWHKQPGEAHAEVEAINSADENLADATLYCNLEPCCHTNKRTPPCVPSIIKSGITKVVISNLDPNPAVSGKGIMELRNAGVEVFTDVLKNEGEYLNKVFFKFIKTGIPFVILKIAQSNDGFITNKKGSQFWITGKESKRFVHRLRATYDSVLVGAETVRIDNPSLNVREVGGKDPIKIILTNSFRFDPSANIFKPDGKENIFVTSLNQPMMMEKEINNTSILSLGEKPNNKTFLIELLKSLAEKGITSVLVEGGAKIFELFYRNNVFDEFIRIKSNKNLGDGVKALENFTPNDLFLVKKIPSGTDQIEIYRRY
ncbi:MAG: bifunctional diaminohydroxyphosphoribosylaminopyrimidine deaminase/5-amino-6-(5-phosphoribosylamino)uracil reductase RibD [Melioribacteraceae bacterium]|nr:bifunctional diaminohydroxyphosphoribosylaminopyrimidine deaminase/5-amino-6-(5-phosphoribosylamino)uracil reductase RibD [Melioribacteraceae bacterium]MCF8265611.1 bifunctional diaminohydroxyphosphoribosylaminopyrimidine deaminase/5-amino-6-(5-phosphoribosylamino)uracil reductase RibD [Melioribacteraceae bacterium]